MDFVNKAAIARNGASKITGTELPKSRIISQTALRYCCESGKAADLWNAQSEEWRATAIRRMERSCFNAVVTSCCESGIDRVFTDQKFVGRYSATCARVGANLRDHSYLIEQLIAGTINPENVGEMTSEQLCPEAGREERAEIELRKKQKTDQKVSREYQCRRCGDNKTVRIEFQARAADEISSFSVKCVSCGHVWRF